ncbi:MAG TPA: YeeE/YedE thiosulfate transporter family protein, partial [Spirochaetales bacterium]|nr:YeeE/YedE thiosulfate transporter family protein [Spirochaetales bacterium]
MELIYGLVTGIVFGFLTQKARVLRYDKQLGALRLRDMTIVKFMLSNILVAMVGIYLLHDLGLVKLSVKATVLGPNIVGGLLFGLGWGLLGYCPGTSAGALGEGRLDALWGIAGMLATIAEAQKFGLSYDVVDDLTGKKMGRASSGTFRTADVVGLDTMAHVIKTLQDNLKDDPFYPSYATPPV